jgi:hypothetical protein
MIIRGGYILQPRCIDDSDIMHEPPVVRELWFYLLRRVNHTDNGQYKRGSGFFNLGEIQEALHWYSGYRKMKYSKPQLTKSLRKLRGRNMVATAEATHGVYITILNYDYYQNPDNYGGNGGEQTKETRRKREGHTKNKNEKECKNERNNPPKSPQGDSRTGYTQEFLKFWEVYPRKVGKAAAFKAWKAKNGTRPPAGDLIKIIETHKQSTQWNREGGQYIPNPATWINQERWEDDLSNNGTPLSNLSPKQQHNARVLQDFIENGGD